MKKIFTSIIALISIICIAQIEPYTSNNSFTSNTVNEPKIYLAEFKFLGISMDTITYSNTILKNNIDNVIVKNVDGFLAVTGINLDSSFITFMPIIENDFSNYSFPLQKITSNEFRIRIVRDNNFEGTFDAFRIKIEKFN